jgi:acetyl esterase/lipase
VLDALKTLNPKPIETLSPVEARQQPTAADAMKQLLKKEGKSVEPDASVGTEDTVYQAAEGTQKARIYKAANLPPNAPALLYFHGGGWVIAGIDTYDASARSLAKETGAIVISADYRDAPENKFPAAHDDAIAAWKWTLANAQRLGGDPRRIAIAGESAGGNLAINVSIAAREGKLQMPVHQLLVYPVAGVNMDTPSYRANAEAKPLNKPMMGWFFKQVMRSDGDMADPRLDLIGKADLSNMPPTTIITAAIDPLNSDGRLLGNKLRETQTKLQIKDYPGVTHEFFGMGAVVAKAGDAMSFAARELRNSFDAVETTGTTPRRTP